MAKDEQESPKESHAWWKKGKEKEKVIRCLVNGGEREWEKRRGKGRERNKGNSMLSHKAIAKICLEVGI